MARMCPVTLEITLQSPTARVPFDGLPPNFSIWGLRETHYIEIDVTVICMSSQEFEPSTSYCNSDWEV